MRRIFADRTTCDTYTVLYAMYHIIGFRHVYIYTYTVTRTVGRIPSQTKQLSQNWTKLFEIFMEAAVISLLGGKQKELQLVRLPSQFRQKDFHSTIILQLPSE